VAKRSSIKIRSKRLNGKIQVRTLIAHPMENGRNRDDDTGVIIPAHFIQEFTVKLNDQLILSSNLGGSISKNPFFTLMLKTAQPGDKVTISWVDNQQLSDTEDHIIK
jgi:sulfur-oxidizing protein SoxZ